MQKVSEEAEKTFREKCTFSPKKETREPKGKKHEVVLSKERLGELAKNKQDLVRKRQKEKELRETEEFTKLPFKPTIHTLPPEYGHPPQPSEDVPLVERLMFQSVQVCALDPKNPCGRVFSEIGKKHMGRAFRTALVIVFSENS